MSGHDGRGDDPRTRWNDRWRARAETSATPTGPASVLTERDALLPASGRALDVAGGTGRNARWLAARGLEVTLVDVSDTACADATRLAVGAGLSLDVVRADLTVDPVPAGPWDVIVVHHWLDRTVWSELPAHLAPGGVLLLCQPTVTNLERHDRPSRRWLLDDGEAAELAAQAVAEHADVEVLEVVEGWTDEGRHEAVTVLRRRGPAGGAAG